MTTASELVDPVPGRMPRPWATRDGAMGGDPASSMMNSGTLTRVPEVLAADALSGACPSAARATPPPIRTTAGAAAQMRRHGIMTVRACSCLLTTRLLAVQLPTPGACDRTTRRFGGSHGGRHAVEIRHFPSHPAYAADAVGRCAEGPDMSSRNPSGLHLLPRFWAGVAVLAVTMTGVSGCSSGSPRKAAAPSTPPIPATTPARAPAVNPLTGVGAPPSGPVIAVKVDDTENGRPSRGIDQADVIYLEQAEGGLSRMLAVFSGHRPRVEAVRSVRTSDPELLAQYGRVVLVFSGGARPVLPIIDRSLLHTVVNDRGGPGFSRDRSRPAPYNLVSDLAVVAPRVKGDGVRDVGFRFASSDPRLASAPAGTQVRTSVGATTVTFVWDAARHRYVRTIGGRRLATAGGVVLGKPN